jgi:hypothetical protein
LGELKHKLLVYDYVTACLVPVNDWLIIPADTNAVICGTAIRISMEANEKYDQAWISCFGFVIVWLRRPSIKRGRKDCCDQDEE